MKHKVLMPTLVLLAVSSSGFLTIIPANIESQINPRQLKYQNLFAIGDSLIDGGAIVGAGTLFAQDSHIVKHLLGIKSVRLDDPYYENRTFSNGPSAIEILSQKLHVPFKAGWDFKTGLIWKTHYQQVGTNYATGGARIGAYDFPTSVFLNNFSFANQVHALLAQHQLTNEDLIYINIGINDFTWQKDFSVQANGLLMTKMVEKIYAMGQKLINHGAKNLIISNLPDYGLTPWVKQSPQGYEISQTLKVYNQKLSAKLALLKQKNQQINLKMHDLFSTFHQLKQEFKARGPQYKFSNASIMNFGDFLKVKGIFKPVFVQGANEDNLDNYFFFDESHPTKWAHEQIAERLYNLII